jgi:hypothetical protein
MKTCRIMVLGGVVLLGLGEFIDPVLTAVGTLLCGAGLLALVGQSR